MLTVNYLLFNLRLLKLTIQEYWLSLERLVGESVSETVDWNLLSRDRFVGEIVDECHKVCRSVQRGCVPLLTSSRLSQTC